MARNAKQTPSKTMAEKQVDRDLTEALKQTFPASDPTAVGQPTGANPPPAPGEPLSKDASARKNETSDGKTVKTGKSRAEKETSVESKSRSILPGPPIPPSQQKQLKRKQKTGT